MYSQVNDDCDIEVYLGLARHMGFVEDSPIRPHPPQRADVPQSSAGYIPFTLWNNYRTGFARKGQGLDSAALGGRMNGKALDESYNRLKTRYYEVEEAIRFL